MYNNIPQRKYPILLLDPPWDYSGSPDKWGAAGKEYDLLKPEEIAQFPVPYLLETPGLVFLWATCPKLDIAIDTLRSWDLHYRGVAFVWVKTKKDGTPIGAQGVRPSTVKPLTELVLVGSNRKNGRPLPVASEAVVQTILAPKQEHSEKPVEIFSRIDALYPSYDKLECFGRGKAQDGWDIWGDEAE